jgi:hypothetical protein
MRKPKLLNIARHTLRVELKIKIALYIKAELIKGKRHLEIALKLQQRRVIEASLKTLQKHKQHIKPLLTVKKIKHRRLKNVLEI